MERELKQKIEKNLASLAKKHRVVAKIFVDEKEVVEMEIKKDTLYLDSRNVLKLLSTPQLLKLGLALRVFFGKNYKIRMKRGLIKTVLGKS